MHTIIHIGAGQANELPQWLETGAKQIVLVEPNPELAEQLRQRTARHTQVTVLEAAITTEPANNQLREYNLPEANGLRLATGLKESFPGLKVLNTHAVATLTPAQLLEQFPLTSSQPASLILQAAGEEHQILQALIKTDQLKCFSELNLHANPEPYYEGSVDAEKTLKALTDYGYDIANENQQDPDWPSWILTRNPLKDRVNALQVENEKLRTERQELDEKHQQTQQQLEKLKAQHEKTLQASKSQTEELSACTQQRGEAQKALTEELAAHKKTSESLEEHKQWFRSRKQQAEQLQVELSEAKEQCAVLKIELEALKQEKQQILQSQNLSQNAVSQLEQKMEQLFSQQAGQLQRTANALGQHVTRSFQGQRQHIQNVASLGQYFESGAQPLEFGQWAIGADLATHLVRAIEQNNYDLILEFGSGTSTVLMARALLNQQGSAPTSPEQNALTYDAAEAKPSPFSPRERGRGRGGEGHSDHTTEYDLPKRILSFEQTKAFQQKTATALSHEGLTSLVDLVLAPLVPMPANSHQSNAPLFYDCATQLARVAQLFEGRQARLLILVDGPHSPDGNPQAREPALGCLLQHLSAHQLDIILDDSNRQGEQQVLEAWKSTCEQRGLNCQHEQLNTEKGATWLTVAP